MSSRKRGRLSASIIQPVQTHQQISLSDRCYFVTCGKISTFKRKILCKSRGVQPVSHQAYISPWSCRHLWYRLVVEAVAPLSPGPQLFHWLGSHHMVWSRMSSAPKLSHLEKGGQLVHVSLMMSCHSLRFAPNKREEMRVTGCKLSK